MAVNENPTEYTGTATLTPAGTDTVGPDLDNHLRSMKGNVGAVMRMEVSTAARGRLWADQSASPVVTVKYSDGTDEIALFEIDESANTVQVYAGATALFMGTVGREVVGGETTASAQQAMATEVGVDVEAYDAATAKTDVSATWTAPQNFGDQIIQRSRFLDYGEVVNSLGALGGGTAAIDMEDGNVVEATISSAAETFLFQNPNETGVATSFTLFLTNGGSQTVTWPASVIWPDSAAPSLVTAGLDVLSFVTLDAGSAWVGFASGTF